MMKTGEAKIRDMCGRILLVACIILLTAGPVCAQSITISSITPSPPQPLIEGTKHDFMILYTCSGGFLTSQQLVFDLGTGPQAAPIPGTCVCSATPCSFNFKGVTMPAAPQTITMRIVGSIGFNTYSSGTESFTVVAAASCPSGTCTVGENCPADASSCPDNVCRNPTCTSGCGETMITNAVDVGECDATTTAAGCAAAPCTCSASGSCVSASTPPPPPPGPPPPPPPAASPVIFYDQSAAIYGAGISSGGLTCGINGPFISWFPVYREWFTAGVGGGTSPYIYVWQLDGEGDDGGQYVYPDTDQDFAIGRVLGKSVSTCNSWTWPGHCNIDIGFRSTLDVTSWPSGTYNLCLRASDDSTDTQILDRTLISQEMRTLYTRMSTNCPQFFFLNGKTFYYTSNDPDSAYRLFEKDTSWIKILGITPQLYDSRINEYFTRTTEPNNINTNVYIIAGTKVKNADTFPGSGFFEWNYVDPIQETMTVVVDYGPSAPRYSHSMRRTFEIPQQPWLRSLLAFPPADSIGYFVYWVGPYTQDTVLHHNTVDGWRYSFYTDTFQVPEAAEVIDMTATYYFTTAISDGFCTVRDESTVYDKYFIRQGQISKADLSDITIDLTGYYDIVRDPLTGQDMAKGGYIHINMDPDELAGIRLDVDNNKNLVPTVLYTGEEILPAAKYQYLLFPARHVMYHKGKVGVGPNMKTYMAEDDYGFKSTDFGYNAICLIPVCTGDCQCSVTDPLNPVCRDYSKDPMNPRVYEPNSDDDLTNDCRCALDEECIKDPCSGPYASDRTYHNDEGSYFDFVDLYTQTLTPPEMNIYTYPDYEHNKRIVIDKVIEETTPKKDRPPDKWFCFCTTEGASGASSWTKLYTINYVPYTLYVKGCPDSVQDPANDHECGCTVDHLEPFATFLEAGFVGDGLITVEINDGVPFIPAECTFDVGSSVSFGYPPGTTAWQGIYEITDCGRFGPNTIGVNGDHGGGGGDLGLSGCIHIKYEEQNSRTRVQELYYSTYGIPEAEFEQYALATVFTFFRNKTFVLKDTVGVIRRLNTNMVLTFSPPLSSLERGDMVTATVTLTDETGAAVVNQDVEVSVPGYENQLIGVWWSEGKAHVTTNNAGQATFSFRLGYAPAQISAKYNGIYVPATAAVPAYGYIESQASAVVGISQVQTSLVSTDFLLLVLIMFILLLFWRWFRGGRLDFYNMWQEFRGEATDEE